MKINKNTANTIMKNTANNIMYTIQEPHIFS